MKRFSKYLLALLFLVLLVAPRSHGQVVAPMPQPTYVGIRTERFNYAVSAQQTPMWCWAACIEMVFRYYGFNVPQKDIVSLTYGTDMTGNPPPFGATLDIITKNLNRRGTDKTGQKYVSKATIRNSTQPDSVYLNELRHERPLIIAYGPSANQGHVVVVTAASFINYQGQERIYSFVVRDPYPTPQNIQNLGRVEYLNYGPPPVGLPAPIQAIWFVTIEKDKSIADNSDDE